MQMQKNPSSKLPKIIPLFDSFSSKQLRSEGICPNPFGRTPLSIPLRVPVFTSVLDCATITPRQGLVGFSMMKRRIRLCRRITKVQRTSC